MKTRLVPNQISVALQDAHVLVVEDDISRYVEVRQALNEIGIGKCEWKTRGWDIVEFAQTMCRVDLILIDWQEIWQNKQMLTHIRSDNHLQNARVVAMGLDMMQLVQIQELSLIMDAMVTFPSSDKQFCTRISQILQGK